VIDIRIWLHPSHSTVTLIAPPLLGERGDEEAGTPVFRLGPARISSGARVSYQTQHAITGTDPEWLYFDSKIAPYPELSTLNQRGIWFITIRQRGAAILRHLHTLPANTWQHAVIDTAQHRHQHSRSVDETVRLPGYLGGMRQVALTN
jgi:hypothetical protein